MPDLSVGNPCNLPIGTVHRQRTIRREEVDGLLRKRSFGMFRTHRLPREVASLRDTAAIFDAPLQYLEIRRGEMSMGRREGSGLLLEHHRPGSGFWASTEHLRPGSVSGGQPIQGLDIDHHLFGLKGHEFRSSNDGRILDFTANLRQSPRP